MSDVIVFEGLRKEFRSLRRGATVALDGLNLSVPAGGVFGFFGPNGAGRTNVVITVLGHAASPGTQMTIALSHSHVVVLVYVVGLLALAFVVFARRDVT
jgi:ABC-type multidrug transport system ATPase subunit